MALPLLGLVLGQCVSPASATPPERGAVIVVHGGGWHSGSPAHVAPICDELAAWFDCFAPSYTLSTAAPYPAANRDLARYVADLREQGYTWIAGVGISAGGTLVVWLAERGWLDAIVTWSAPSDLRTIDWYRRVGWVVDLFAPTPLKRERASVGPVPEPHLILHSWDEWLPRNQARALGHVTWVEGDRHGINLASVAVPLTVNHLLAAFEMDDGAS